MRKRATMMLDSDDEDDNILGALPPPNAKKRKEEDIDNLATGPDDFIKTLTEAGFHPRTGNLPNLLSLFHTMSVCITYSLFLILIRCSTIRVPTELERKPNN